MSVAFGYRHFCFMTSTLDPTERWMSGGPSLCLERGIDLKKQTKQLQVIIIPWSLYL